VLTGHVLKDPEYILKYHGGSLELDGRKIAGTFANQPRPLPADAASLRKALESV
jgi:hypothetical protein